MASREDGELGCSVPSPYPGSWQNIPGANWIHSCFKLIVKTCVCFVNSKVSIWSPIVVYCIFSNGPTSGPWFHKLLKASFSLRNFPNSWAELFQPTPGPGCGVLFRFCIFLNIFSWFMMPTCLSVVVVLLQSIAWILDCMSSSIGFGYI